MMRALLLAAVLALPGAASAEEAVAYFAGGCFWCTEADFEKLVACSQMMQKTPLFIDQTGGISIASQSGAFGAHCYTVMRERGYGRDTRLLVLGQARRPRQTISRGFVKIVNPDYRVSFSRRSSGRLQLADWLVAPNNPLTSRVMVNRIWHHLFGQGMLKNMDNFGSTGGDPSHPELLDWLARDFISSGWNLHHLLTQMVLSSTYRQSSKITEDALDKDPQNSGLLSSSHCPPAKSVSPTLIKLTPIIVITVPVTNGVMSLLS